MKRLLYVLILLLSPLLWGQGYTNAGGGSVPAGSGTGFLSVGGVLCKGAPAAATTGTAEEVLATCTIPANTVTASGSSLRLHFFAHTAANANNKLFRVRIGGISGAIVLAMGATALNDKNVSTYGPVIIQRTGATTATAWGFLVDGINATASNGTIAPYILTTRAMAVTWANANDLVITATTATAAGDATLDSYFVEVVQ